LLEVFEPLLQGAVYILLHRCGVCLGLPITPSDKQKGVFVLVHVSLKRWLFCYINAVLR